MIVRISGRRGVAAWSVPVRERQLPWSWRNFHHTDVRSQISVFYELRPNFSARRRCPALATVSVHREARPEELLRRPYLVLAGEPVRSSGVNDFAGQHRLIVLPRRVQCVDAGVHLIVVAARGSARDASGAGSSWRPVALLGGRCSPVAEATASPPTIPLDRYSAADPPVALVPARALARTGQCRVQRHEATAPPGRRHRLHNAVGAAAPQLQIAALPSVEEVDEDAQDGAFNAPLQSLPAIRGECPVGKLLLGVRPCRKRPST